jgi:FtsH-binding integral membrane protein
MGYGMFTKNDLTTLGRILTFGVIGLALVTLIFMVLSFFMHLPMLDLLISYLGLAIFVGLTAYDAQTIRKFSQQAEINSVASYKLSMIMALKMYINVIMIFWYLLRIFSNNRR